jgi:hypothetical protein
VSDLARVYTPSLAPGLISGTAASNAAGAGVPEVSGQEKATHKNSNLGHDYRDDRTK